MHKNTAWTLVCLILLAAFFLRQYRLLDFPYHGDEVEEGDIALEILHGNLAPFYPQNEGNEALYQFVLAPFFAVLGDSVIANRFPSAAWSMVLVALMYAFGRVLFRSRRVGVMSAGLTAALWWPTVFGRLGLREISQPVMMVLALTGLVLVLRADSDRNARNAGIVGGICAGLTAYTFLSGRAFPIVVVLFLVYMALLHREQLDGRRHALVIYTVLMLALTSGLFLYLNAHPELDFHTRDLAGQSWMAQGDFAQVVPQVLKTLGMFTFNGDMNWVRNIPGRPVFPGPEGLLFYAGIALALWRWRKPEYMLLLSVLATFLVPNIIANDPPWFTRSIGILPAVLVLPALPLEWVWTRVNAWRSRHTDNRSGWTRAVYPALVALLGVSIYVRTASDMFQVWIDNPGVYWMTLAFYDGAGKYVNHSADTTPFNYVMDVYTAWREHNVGRVIQRPDIAVRYSVDDALVLPADSHEWRIAFQIQGAPSRVLLDAFVDLNAPIYVDPRVDSAGQRPLRVYSISRERLDRHLERASQGPVFLPGSAAPVTDSIQVGDVLQFLGCEVLDPGAAGDDLNALTFWKVLRRPPEMAVFLHLLGPDGTLVAQSDGFNAVVGDLIAGDTVAQLHTIHLPGNLPSGTYRFELGAYTRRDLKRLPLSTGTDSVWFENVVN